MANIMNICPPESELLEIADVYQCIENGCTSSFKKLSNFQLHLVKHHKIGKLESKFKGMTLRYFCPREDCNYNLSFGCGKSFAQKRFLKQHYMKVHAEKVYQCDQCGLKTSLISAYNRHVKVCGVKYVCSVCEWEYNTHESLLVHLMRKHPLVHKAYLENKSRMLKVQQNVEEKNVCTIEEKNTLNDNLTEKDICFNSSKTEMMNSEMNTKYEDIKSRMTPNDILSLLHNIRLEHDYAKLSLDDKIKNSSIRFVSIDKSPVENNNIHQFSFKSSENKSTHVLIPIELFNQNNEPMIGNTKVNRNAEKTIQIQTENSKEIENILTKKNCVYKDEFTQTSLKLRKKSKNSSVDKSSVETQTFNQTWNTKKDKNNHVDATTQSLHVRKRTHAQLLHLDVKLIKDKRKCKQNDSKKSSKKKNDCTDVAIKCEVQNIELSPPKTNNIYYKDIVSNDDTFDRILSSEKKDHVSRNDKSENNISFDFQKDNVKLSISSDLNTNHVNSNLVTENINLNNKTIDRQSEYLSNNNMEESKTLSNSNSMDFNCQFDFESMITQSSDIETQTALDELLYCNIPKCDDLPDNNLFSDSVSLSDIQTQTTWPSTSYDYVGDFDMESSTFSDKKQNSIFISAETQTMDIPLNNENNLDLSLSNYVYDIDKNSPLFEGNSPHYCFKETQTCLCFLDSLKYDDSSNHLKVIQDVPLLEGSKYNCLRNFIDSSPKSCLSTSAETQTQFSFENTQFLNRKSDVLLSCSTIETQTCFEDAYLEDIMESSQKDI